MKAKQQERFTCDFPKPEQKTFRFHEVKEEAGVYICVSREKVKAAYVLVSTGLGIVMYISDIILAEASEVIWKDELFEKSDKPITVVLTNNIG